MNVYSYVLYSVRLTDRRYWNNPLTEKKLSDIINGDDSELDHLDIEVGVNGE